MSSHFSRPLAQSARCKAISMAKSNVIYLCVWSGDTDRARDLVGSRYPGIEIVEFPYRRLRESSFSERIRLLHGFRGWALVFYFQSFSELKHRQILECIHFLHRCRETVLCDSGAGWERMRTIDILRSAPGVLLSILLDLKTLIFWRCYLKLLLMQTTMAPTAMGSGEPEIAYLIPSSESMGSVGGAISHIRGFLYGLKSSWQNLPCFYRHCVSPGCLRKRAGSSAKRPLLFLGNHSA